MKQNETLKAMLADYRPDLGDGDEYMQRLAAKLDAADAVRQLFEKERRRYRSRLVVAFAAGGVAGVLSAFYLMLHPIVVQSPAVEIPILTQPILLEHVGLIVNILTVAVIGVCAAVFSTQFYRLVKRDYPI